MQEGSDSSAGVTVKCTAFIRTPAHSSLVGLAPLLFRWPAMLLDQHCGDSGYRNHADPVRHHLLAVDQLEHRVLSFGERLVGKYRKAASVPDSKVRRGVFGYLPASADEELFYLFLGRACQPLLVASSAGGDGASSASCC